MCKIAISLIVYDLKRKSCYKLNGSDDYFIKVARELSGQVQQVADEILQLIDQNEIGKAQGIIKDLAFALREPQQKLGETMRQLRALQADFIALSGVV